MIRTKPTGRGWWRLGAAIVIFGLIVCSCGMAEDVGKVENVCEQFMEAGKVRLQADTARNATQVEVET